MVDITGQYMLNLLLNGLLIGVIYALIAFGLTLIFSVLGIVSFAHGEFYMIGVHRDVGDSPFGFRRGGRPRQEQQDKDWTQIAHGQTRFTTIYTQPRGLATEWVHFVTGDTRNRATARKLNGSEVESAPKCSYSGSTDGSPR